MIDPRTSLPVGDPDMLWAEFQAHVKACPHCSDVCECPVGKQLGDAWYHADGIAAKQSIETELAQWDDGTADRGDA